MDRTMWIHHIINLILLIILFILNLTHLGGTVALVILAILFVINTLLSIRTNKKHVKNNSVTKNDYKQK